MPELTVGLAAPGDARACRLLLPALFGAAHAPDLLVARQDGHLVGALGMGTLGTRADGAFEVLVEVPPPGRRQGVGRALLAAAAGHAGGRTPGLRTLKPVEQGGGAAGFLHACGWVATEVIHHFETDVARFHAATDAVRRRLVASGRVPPGAAVVRLRDAPAAAVAELVSRTFPVALQQVLTLLQPGAPDGYALDLSVAALLDGRLCGVLVYRWNAGVPVIEVRVVEPGLQRGWANVLLLEAATRHGMEAGANRFRFYADGSVGDTMRLARRAEAVPFRTELHFTRPVP